MIHKVKEFELVLGSFPFKVNILGDRGVVLKQFEFNTEKEANQALSEMIDELHKEKENAKSENRQSHTGYA